MLHDHRAHHSHPEVGPIDRIRGAAFGSDDDNLFRRNAGDALTPGRGPDPGELRQHLDRSQSELSLWELDRLCADQYLHHGPRRHPGSLCLFTHLLNRRQTTLLRLSHHTARCPDPEGKFETILSRTNYNEMYYSAPQQLPHQAISGCPMRVGDLLDSGTISGPQKGNRGSLLELSWAGKEPLTLDTARRAHSLKTAIP